MSPGVPIRTSFLPVSSCRKSCAGAGPRFEDMVRYMESASEGLAHHFAVEDDELRLKTNIRGGPLSAQPRLCRAFRRRFPHQPICRPSQPCRANQRFVELAIYALASRLRASWMEARATKAPRVSARFSKSLAKRRSRPNQEKVRSTTPRRGRTTKPFVSSLRLTISRRSEIVGARSHGTARADIYDELGAFGVVPAGECRAFRASARGAEPGRPSARNRELDGGASLRRNLALAVG
jgi:hypothetical protein